MVVLLALLLRRAQNTHTPHDLCCIHDVDVGTADGRIRNNHKQGAGGDDVIGDGISLSLSDMGWMQGQAAANRLVILRLHPGVEQAHSSWFGGLTALCRRVQQNEYFSVM